MSAVPTNCSEADGVSANKETCRLSRSATRLYVHPVPVLIHLITPVANCRISALLIVLFISSLRNKICALSSVLHATYPAHHGPTEIRFINVHYCLGVEGSRERLEDQVCDRKIKLA